MVKETKVVTTTPEVTLEKKPELILVHIDREMTDGGLRTNGKLYVGDVRVTPEMAKDLLRRQEEYFETKRKLMDKNVSVRMKSDFQKEAMFLADPSVHGMKKNFSRDFGLLPPQEWAYCTEAFKKDLLEKRKALYGY